MGYLLLSYTTLPISRWHGGLILTTSGIIRNELLEYNGILVCSGTRNMVSYRQEVTIGHREPETITTCKMLHILLVLGQMTIVDPLT